MCILFIIFKKKFQVWLEIFNIPRNNIFTNSLTTSPWNPSDLYRSGGTFWAWSGADIFNRQIPMKNLDNPFFYPNVSPFLIVNIRIQKKYNPVGKIKLGDFSSFKKSHNTFFNKAKKKDMK